MIDINKLTVIQLKEYCKNNNIKGYSKFTKREDLLSFVNKQLKQIVEKPKKIEKEIKEELKDIPLDVNFNKTYSNLDELYNDFDHINNLIYNKQLNEKQSKLLVDRRIELIQLKKQLEKPKQITEKIDFPAINYVIGGIDVEKKFRWSEGTITQTKYGRKILRKLSSISQEFWQLWKINKEELKRIGISVSKYNEQWQVAWWIDSKNKGSVSVVGKLQSLKDLYGADNSTVVIEINDVNSTMDGNPSLLVAIDDYYTYYAKGYKFSELYKSGKWDGKVHVINMKSKPYPTMPKNLAYDIADRRNDIRSGLNVRVFDYRKNTSRIDKFYIKNIELYDYQEDAIKKAIKAKCGMIVSATGSGKTEIASGIIARYGKNNDTMFLVHTTALQDQAEERLELRLGTDVGVSSSTRHELKNTTKGDVNVITTQSMYSAIKAKRSGKPLTDKQKEILKAYENAEVVIQDEAHHVKAKTFKSVIDEANTKHLYGLTATPYRDENDEKEVFSRFGKKIVNISVDELIDKKRLVQPTIRIVSVPACNKAKELSYLPNGVKKYALIKIAQIVSNESRNEMIARLALSQEKKGKTTLIFVDRIDHGNRLSALTNRPFLNGEDQSKRSRLEHKKIVKEVAEGKINTIIATQQLFGEGFDLPAIDSLIIADAGGKSKVKTMQRVGRALRTKFGKTSTEIFEFRDEIDYLDDHTDERVKTYKENKNFNIEK